MRKVFRPLALPHLQKHLNVGAYIDIALLFWWTKQKLYVVLLIL